ncbi:hypothetical protein WJX81_005734 [Elliptochloris bilobata]|uniref:HORMA domain-containing protein n=1 Tax=Elliptochloris bilobata TaxID=381761 RepID=A0AAW1RWK0_9CHLO
MSGTAEGYTSFLQLHKPQLVHSAVPERLWQTLYQKLECQSFDAAEVFTFCHDASSQPQWTVICLEDLASGSGIYLVDHAVTFGKAEELAEGLECDPALLQRLAALMELTDSVNNGPDGSQQLVPAENAAPADMRRAVLANLHLHAYEFSLAACKEGERLPERPRWSTPEEVSARVRYVHDELGSRIRFPAPGGAPPGFQLAPFLWCHTGQQEALSILWPIRNVAAGEQATRVPQLGISNYSEPLYWEHRFSIEAEKDWYCSFEVLKPALLRHCPPNGAPVLHPGCGNSLLGCQLADVGYAEVVNTDAAANVIVAMRARYGGTPGMSWEAADMCACTRWRAGHFGLAVDKAVLDALMTSRVECGHAWRAASADLAPARAYLAELHRLLAPGTGRLVIVSLRSVENLLPCLSSGPGVLGDACGSDSEATYRLAAACLFLATKVEETPSRTNDLLNAVRFAALHMLAAADPARPGTPALPDYGAPRQLTLFAPLVGEEYYAAKERLILDEQVLLRTLRFELIAEQPHRYLLNFCRLLHCSHAITKLAICLVNDSLQRTCLCTRYSAAEVAAGALHLAVLLLGASMELPHSGRLGWWDAVGVPLGTVEAVSHLLAQAQAQAQQQAEITSTESLELVRCLLRVSIFHTAWLRGIFPDSYFKSVQAAGLDGLNVKLLVPSKDPNAQRLVDWVEHGVHEAIQLKYLKALHFGFSSDASGENLLEEYVYHFAYDGSKVHLSANGADVSVSQSTQNNIKTVKYQIVRLIRVLVEVCGTLDEVPDERFVYMKLDYYDGCPPEYEPPGFRPMENASAVHFSRKPFYMTVGGVHTAHHSVALKVKSALDCLGDEDEQMPGAAQEQQNSTKPDLAQIKETTEKHAPKEAHKSGPPDKAATAAEDSQRTCDPSIDPLLEPLSAFCRMRGPAVHLTDAMVKFHTVPVADLERCFEQLVHDGLLERTGVKDVYKVCGGKQAPDASLADDAMHPAHSISNVMGRLGGLSMNAAGHVDALKGRYSERGFRDMDSQQGGVFESNGSGAMRSGMPATEACGAARQDVRSGNRAGRGASGAALTTAPDVAGQDPTQCFFTSQQSQDAVGRKRKASVVQDPIRQEPRTLNPNTEPQAPVREPAAPPPAQKVRRSQRATTRRLTAMQA